MRNNITPNKSPGIRTGCGWLYCNSLYEDGKIIRVLPNMGKMGGCSSATISGIRHLINLALRKGATVDEIYNELVDIGCHRPCGLGKNKTASCIDGMAKLIKQASDELVKEGADGK